MFIVLMDEPGLFVFPSVEKAEHEIEYQDAGEIRAAFDEDAVPYRVEWLRIGPPNRTPIPGLGETNVDPGPTTVVDSLDKANTFRPRPSGPPDPEGLIALIETYQSNVTPATRHEELAVLIDRLGRND